MFRFKPDADAETHPVADDDAALRPRAGATAEKGPCLGPGMVQGPSEGRSGGRPRRELARFCNLYESRDGGLCVFEDEQGHLVAVDASRLV